METRKLKLKKKKKKKKKIIKQKEQKEFFHYEVQISNWAVISNHTSFAVLAAGVDHLRRGLRRVGSNKNRLDEEMNTDKLWLIYLWYYNHVIICYHL